MSTETNTHGKRAPKWQAAESPGRQPSFEVMLDSDEAAAFLKIHPKTLQRMARQGRVPAFRIGDLWRFRASELDAWLASTMVSSNRHSCRD